MRKRGSKKKLTLIDLTPLLDVVFIVLLVVILKNQTMARTMEDEMNDANDRAQTAEEERDKAVQEEEAAEAQTDTYANIYNYVGVVTLYVTYDEKDIKSRTIYILKDSADENNKEQIDVLNGAETMAYAELKTKLEAYIDAHQEEPILMRLDDDKLLYRDAQRVIGLFEELKKEYEDQDLIFSQ